MAGFACHAHRLTSECPRGYDFMFDGRISHYTHEGGSRFPFFDASGDWVANGSVGDWLRHFGHTVSANVDAFISAHGIGTTPRGGAMVIAPSINTFESCTIYGPPLQGDKTIPPGHYTYIVCGAGGGGGIGTVLAASLYGGNGEVKIVEATHAVAQEVFMVAQPGGAKTSSTNVSYGHPGGSAQISINGVTTTAAGGKAGGNVSGVDGPNELQDVNAALEVKVRAIRNLGIGRKALFSYHYGGVGAGKDYLSFLSSGSPACIIVLKHLE